MGSWHTHTSSFLTDVGSTALLRWSIQALHKTGGELSFTARCFFVSLRHQEVELLPKGNFWSHFLAVSCHRALLKHRYLDSTTSNLENWVLFFPEKGGGCTENERQKWRVDQWRIYSHTWSGAVGLSHTGVDGARHRCAQWGGDRLVCHQSNTQCTQRVVKKVGQSTNFESLNLGHFVPDLDNSPLIRFLFSCRKRNKSGNSVFRILKKSPEVSNWSDETHIQWHWQNEQEALCKPCKQHDPASTEWAAVAQHDTFGAIAIYTLLIKAVLERERLVISSSTVRSRKVWFAKACQLGPAKKSRL